MLLPDGGRVLSPPPVCAERQPALLHVSDGDRMRFDMVKLGHWRDLLKPKGGVSTYLQICKDLSILMVPGEIFFCLILHPIVCGGTDKDAGRKGHGHFQLLGRSPADTFCQFFHLLAHQPASKRYRKATVRRIRTVADYLSEIKYTIPAGTAAARIYPVTSVADNVRTRGFVHVCFILTPPLFLLIYFHHAAQTS